MTKEAITFRPPTEKIVVKPIMRVRNPMVTDPQHEAYFLFGNANIGYMLPIDTQGNLVNPFSSHEEQKWLENELDLDLNYHRVKDNPWHKLKVKLGKDNKVLDLQNPKQYLEYLILKANKLQIAPDGASIKDKATYRYALVSENHEVKQNTSKANLKIEAYTALGKLQDDKEAMINFLKVYGKKVSYIGSKPEFILSQITKIIEEDIEGFLGVYKDKENYEIKLLIAQAVECGAITKKGREFTLPSGDPLANEGDKGTIDNAVKYLKSPANQEVLTIIKVRVDNAKDK